MKVVVTGLIATYPLGGVAWDYLQFVKGFASLGCEVTYLEDTGQWAYDPRRATFSEDGEANARYLHDVMSRVPGMQESFAFRDARGTLYGLAEHEVERRCRAADLFLNVSDSCWLREGYRGARVTACYDSDPLYTQTAWLAADGGDRSNGREPGWYRIYDVFFTMAENVTDPACEVPRCGLEWKTTRQPITLADWPVRIDPALERFTTVMSWKTKPALPVVNGRVYGGKDVEFRRFSDLPRRVRAPLEIAVSGPAPREEMVAAGWRIVDAAGALDDHGALSRLHRRLSGRMERRQGSLRRVPQRVVQLPQRLLPRDGQAGRRGRYRLLANLSDRGGAPCVSLRSRTRRRRSRRSRPTIFGIAMQPGLWPSASSAPRLC